MTYHEFLETKMVIAPESGVEIDPDWVGCWRGWNEEHFQKVHAVGISRM